LIYGDLSGQCAHCQNLDVKLDSDQCPHCQTGFRYITFRNVKTNAPKLEKILAQKPSMTVIDHDDFKRILAAQKAKEFLQ